MILKSQPSDFKDIYEIINDASVAYKGIIPADRWKDPYMTEKELHEQILEGVEFWCYHQDGRILGVMGIQHRGDVTLIRHAYIRTVVRNQGIGGTLLKHLSTLTQNPILIGTWADASWAINFYLKNGFQQVSYTEKEQLLRKYWNIPFRQIETSVVLASSTFYKQHIKNTKKNK
ncbi:GNAT family N-acetyltransferase [Sphingobacterium psychroaquaticum]|uniref:N-acetylglutamate synthase, GNAT family n=1 Tax=Sphingobacterium psychroaquaticum TaxID=561061 RepID=A0A1X7JT85_9SPHI|nr:GNAT family N-acetyltransferase [Sphingobacterium psychroaquaticum]SMG31009.1 N-acetylglutamate synthase, GNAT family [Sphingobacterium psychroaquaticum]